jgi:hypothetical protein
MQALIQHCKNKDQFLKVTIKRMGETQLFEDELKEANESNSILLADKQKLRPNLQRKSEPKAVTLY